jgi:hypothetical protein
MHAQKRHTEAIALADESLELHREEGCLLGYDTFPSPRHPVGVASPLSQGVESLEGRREIMRFAVGIASLGLLAMATGCLKSEPMVDSPCPSQMTIQCVGPTTYQRLKTVWCDGSCSGATCQVEAAVLACPAGQVCVKLGWRMWPYDHCGRRSRPRSLLRCWRRAGRRSRTRSGGSRSSSLGCPRE